MGRLRGSKNKNSIKRSKTSALSTEEKIRLLANLMIERIIEDQKNRKVILGRVSHGKS